MNSKDFILKITIFYSMKVFINYKKDDEKYIIYLLAGEIKFEDNINKCFKLQKTIEKELDATFPKAKKEKINTSKAFDKSGKSKTYMIGSIFLNLVNK